MSKDFKPKTLTWLEVSLKKSNRFNLLPEVSILFIGAK
jgi:hypothetical protein